MANAPKPTTVEKESSSASNVFAMLVIPICIIIGIALFKFVLGDPANFVDNNPENHPLPGNFAGMAYKGGIIVPILMGMFLMVFVFSVERFIVISKATGAGSLDAFVKKIQGLFSFK